VNNSKNPPTTYTLRETDKFMRAKITYEGLSQVR
jgi:hypothetical protein